MVAPVVAALPPAPVRGEDKQVFATKANDMMGALGAFVTETNAVGSYVGDKAAAMQTSVDAAAASASAASTSETNAAASAAAAEQAAADAQAVGLSYQEAKFALGGDFSGNITCVRIGNTVTISGVGSLVGHVSGSSAVSAAGVIPVAFRPSNNVGSSKWRSTGFFSLVLVGTTGALEAHHYDGAGAAVTSTSVTINVTYNITADIV